jgi:hypothetical protein
MYNNTAKQQDIEEKTFCEIGDTLIKTGWNYRNNL